MRKFLFIILLVPIFASLGHDLYIFKENPDKGFRLSALGALWDKYHKETHDQWKTKVREMSETVSETVEDLTPKELMGTDQPKAIETPEEPSEQKLEENPDFMEGFTQIDSKDGETQTKPLEEPEFIQEQTNGVVKTIGFILEQKSVFVFSALAAFFYLLNAILGWIFKKKEGMDEIKSMKKKRKGGGYAYGRK